MGAGGHAREYQSVNGRKDVAHIAASVTLARTARRRLVSAARMALPVKSSTAGRLRPLRTTR
jgi:hypothetical protein